MISAMQATPSNNNNASNAGGTTTKYCLAKAKYDNLAEATDELAFRKGDILTVIEQKVKGINGWWLCSLRGRQGIAPSNRLSLLAGLYSMENPWMNSSAERQMWNSPGSVSSENVQQQSEYDVPRSYHSNVPRSASAQEHLSTGNKQPVRDLVYDIPKSLERLQVRATSSPIREDIYDTPQSKHRLRAASSIDGQSTKSALSPGYKSNTDSAFDMQSDRSSFLSCNSSPPGSSICDSYRSSTELLDIYDVPPSMKRQVPVKQSSLSEGLYDVPKTIRERESLTTNSEISKSKAARDSGIYDNAKPTNIPPNQKSIADKINEIYDQPINGKLHRINSLKAYNSEGVYDVPPQVMRDSNKSTPSSTLERKSTTSHDNSIASIDCTQYEELPLELDAAVEILIKLQQDVTTSTSRLLGFVHPGWRRRKNLETIMYDLKISCIGLQNTVQEFIDFGTGALANSAKLDNMAIAQKLGHQLMPLQDKLDVINASMKALSGLKWRLAKLEDTGDRSIDKDELSQVLLCARQVSEDVSRVASVIHGNSTLIFKRSHSDQQNRPLPSVPSAERSPVPNEESASEVTQDMAESYHEYDYCELQDKVTTPTVHKNFPLNTSSRATLDSEQQSDRQYLDYYLLHVKTIISQVKEYVTKLHTSVGQNDSPQILVANSKLLVSCAHKLVYIGDTLSRTIQVQHTRTTITNSANILCSCLKDAIVCTKEAALASSPGSKTNTKEKLKSSATHVLNAVIAFQSSMTARSS